MIVSTSYHPEEEQLLRAAEAALALQGTLIPRGRLSISQLLSKAGESSLVLVSKQRLEYHQEGQDVLFFHPSMASIRIKRMQNGETDTMIKLSSAAPGDSIIDCTAGLASDSIVFAHAAGERGNVVALESELVLHYLVKNGLAEYNTQNEQLAEAMRRVRLELADHGRYLRECPDNSADVVYFDPMFRKPIHESSAIGSIRSLANGGRIEEDTIRHAVRVARKTVLLKEHRDSGEFARLGFTTVHRTSTKIAYGVITI